MIFLLYNMNANLFLFRLLKITVSLTMVVDREIGALTGYEFISVQQ